MSQTLALSTFEAPEDQRSARKCMVGSVETSPSAAPMPADAQSERAALWTDLVSRMRTQEAAAFETALNLTRDAAWRLACHLLGGDAHLAQDILQEAYIVVFTRLHTLKDPTRFRSWLLGIVLNQCRNARRSQKRVSSKAPEEMPETPSGAFEESLTRRLSVSEALQGMTFVERSAVLLRDYLQLSYQEMASALGVPLGTVKSRLFEARKQLQRRLEGEGR